MKNDTNSYSKLQENRFWKYDRYLRVLCWFLDFPENGVKHYHHGHLLFHLIFLFPYYFLLLFHSLSFSLFIIIIFFFSFSSPFLFSTSSFLLLSSFSISSISISFSSSSLSFYLSSFLSLISSLDILYKNNNKIIPYPPLWYYIYT